MASSIVFGVIAVVGTDLIEQPCGPLAVIRPHQVFRGVDKLTLPFHSNSTIALN
jgi:hypothetical protein